MSSRYEYPGEDKRRPGRGSPGWSVREPLSRWLEQEGRSAGGRRVLDVGCGEKPYKPFFAAASEYVGVDVVATPHADLVGSAEELPVEDGSFDIVLCIQMLEHVGDPLQAVRELHRVTRPGGRVLLSTHGTQVYHPAPEDYWRWTHTGLQRLLECGATWRSITVTPGAGTGACVGMLLATYVDLVAQRLHAVRAGCAVNWVVNRTAAAVDARSRLLREPVPGALFANYHVVAER